MLVWRSQRGRILARTKTPNIGAALATQRCVATNTDIETGSHVQSSSAYNMLSKTINIMKWAVRSFEVLVRFLRVTLPARSPDSSDGCDKTRYQSLVLYTLCCVTARLSAGRYLHVTKLYTLVVCGHEFLCASYGDHPSLKEDCLY